MHAIARKKEAVNLKEKEEGYIGRCRRKKRMEKFN